MAIVFTQLDLNRLEDAPVIAALPDELCEDLDGYGACYCVPPQADADEPPPPCEHPKRHVAYRGLNADGSPFTSPRYFQL